MLDAYRLDRTGLDAWLERHDDPADLELAAHDFIQSLKETDVAVIAKPANAGAGFTIPTDRRKPVGDPWQLAYLLTGEKKVGKTSLAIEGCEELVVQFDKPQLSYNIREVVPSNWSDFRKVLSQLEAKAAGRFPYQRVIIDGAGEWYQMMHVECCRHFGIEHPSEEGFARGWHYIRDGFTDAVNRLLRLQSKTRCGLIFIAHSEWKERNKVEVLMPNLPPRCEEILNGKCDGWFNYGYMGSQRVLTIRGDETIAAGHRIDGHFLTKDGRRIDHIQMGNSAKQAMHNFMEAYHNRQSYVDFDEWRKTKQAAKPTVKVQVKTR